MSPDFPRTIPRIKDCMEGAGHVDSHSIEGNIPFRQQLAQAMNWQPGWLKVLYRIRKVLAGIMGLEHDEMDPKEHHVAQGFPMCPGEKVGFFEVVAAEEERFWMARAEDRHLQGMICMSVEKLDTGRKRFHCTTVVHYRHWIGPIYFNLIRPFHHLIVKCMLRESVKPVGVSGC